MGKKPKPKPLTQAAKGGQPSENHGKKSSEKRERKDKKLSQTQQQRLTSGQGYRKLLGLHDWLLGRGVWLDQQAVTLKAGYNGSGYGYAVVAIKDIKAGQSRMYYFN